MGGRREQREINKFQLENVVSEKQINGLSWPTTLSAWCCRGCRGITMFLCAPVYIAWTVASLLYNGVNLLPIWFFWDTYYDFALASGMEQRYIDSYVRYYTSPGWLAFILLFTTLMGFFGLHGGRSADPQAFSEGRRSMRADASFAVPVKLWALLCVFAGVTIGGNVLLTCILTGGALLYLVLQRSFRLAASYGCFYLLLALLLYGIRFHGLRMPGFFGVLCSDVLESVANFSGVMGSDHHAAGDALRVLMGELGCSFPRHLLPNCSSPAASWSSASAAPSARAKA